MKRHVCGVLILLSALYTLHSQNVRAASPTLLQSATCYLSSTSCTMTITESAGSLLWVGIDDYAMASDGYVYSVSDSLGNVYGTASPPTDSGNANGPAVIETLYAANVSAGSNTITCSRGTHTGGTGRCVVLEYSGIAPAAPLDSHTETSNSTVNYTSGNTSTAYSADLLIGYFVSRSQQTWSNLSGTQRFADNTDLGVLVEDQTTVSAGSYSQSAVASGASPGVGSINAFRVSGSQSQPTPTPTVTPAATPTPTVTPTPTPASTPTPTPTATPTPTPTPGNRGPCEAVSPARCWYVDSSVASNGDGTSWTTAWKNIDNIVGVGPGDVVYISGGPTGTSETYHATSFVWRPAGGTVGHPITYKIGQDSAHNGMAIFDGTGVQTPSYWLTYPSNNTNLSNAVISGDAGDGQQHFTVQNFTAAFVCDYCQNLRVAYTKFTGGAFDMEFGSTLGIEIDHNYIYASGAAIDHFSLGNFSSGTTWDQSMRFHDNIVYMPGSNGSLTPLGYGADALQWSGTGFSIYNNTFIGYQMAYSGGQHQDGWQGLGSYVKIYNNFFYGIPDYAIYGDAYSSGGSTSQVSANHMWIYNNIISNGDGGVIVGHEGWYTGTTNFNDIVIANNVTDHMFQSISFGNTTQYPSTFSNSLIVNNVIVADPTPVNVPLYSADTATNNNNIATVSNNAIITSAQAAMDFRSYVKNNQSNDYHLQAGASNLIGQALNESAYFTSDKDGTSRPSTGPWDIGAYQYSSGGNNPTPTPTPTPTPKPSATPTPTPTPDTIAPTVSITTPTNNSTISGSVTLAASASDNAGGSGVNTVQFKLDGTNLGSALTTPTSGSIYSGTWNTSGVSNGSHTLTAVATDVAGNSATSNTVNVTINNPLPTPTPTPTPTPIGATPTPAPTNSPVSGGGGGGGGGSGGGGSSSGGGASQLPSVGTFTPAVPQKPAIVPINPGGACIPSQTTITKPVIPALLLTLSLGDRGQNVITLQNYLIQGGFLPADDNTGYYGLLTRAAVAAYQSAPATSIRTTSCGTQSGKSRLAQGFSFPTTLSPFTTNANVKNLQIFLNDHGFMVSTSGAGSISNETTYYGPATMKALAKFQAANSISPAIGNFGPITRGVVNQLLSTGY